MVPKIFRILPFYNALRSLILNKRDDYYYNTILKNYKQMEKIGQLCNLIRINKSTTTSVEDYWSGHTVQNGSWINEKKSAAALEERNSMYPLFAEFMDIKGEHEGATVLDYGCGPGNDLLMLNKYGNCRKIIGMDISLNALMLAQYRLALANADPKPINLYQISDSYPNIPLGDGEIDYINCGGVLMHTSFPEKILEEFKRVSKDGAEVRIMVYNRNSIWFHIYVAYEMLAQKGNRSTPDDVFYKTTDGEDCPLARCYDPDVFTEMCINAGFKDVNYIGGYMSNIDIDYYKDYYDKAIHCLDLNLESRAFLEKVTEDHNGYPMHCGKYAGIGGVYILKA